MLDPRVATFDAQPGWNPPTRSGSAGPGTCSYQAGGLLSGRQSLKIGEIGWWRIALALLIYAALAFGHPHLFREAAVP